MPYTFTAGSYGFSISDFGHEMNSLFEKLYNAYYARPAFDFKDFTDQSFDFFEAHKGNYILHGSFFDNFASLWRILMDQQRFNDAEDLWDDVLKLAYNYEEKTGERIHKGTPYYFLGVTLILRKDLDRGFLMMHQALEEDKRSFKDLYTQYPAYFFVTLNYEMNQYFRQQILTIADYIDKRLESYRESCRGSLNMVDFKSRFLMETDLQESVFYFVFSMFRVRKLVVETNLKHTQNVFGSLLQANIIFDLCLVIETILKNKIPRTPKKKYTMFYLLEKLSAKSSLSLNEDKLMQINVSFKDNFSATLQSLLESRYEFRDSTAPQQIEMDLAIAYGFRNFGAHKIEHQSIIYNNFEEISQRIINTLFFSVEKLYLDPHD